MPEVVVEGAIELPDGAIELDSLDDVAGLQSAFDEGRPVVVRADTPEAVGRALARPEVSCVIVPADRSELLELDLRSLTYG